MKIFIMTDMEGAAGVVNRQDWVFEDSQYYEKGRELLTMEVNAAIEGFFEAGADVIYVADGHGGGAVNLSLLDSRVYYVNGFPDPWPFTLDKSFDAVAWVGQHAKAGTSFAHICHTGCQNVIDCTINGVSVGEFGQLAMCAASLGIKSIFGSGDEAFTKEAKALIEGIETVSVKRGLMPGTGDDCTFEEYRNRNIAAVHLHPEKARIFIKNGSKKALERLINYNDTFQLIELKPPFKMITKYRPSDGRHGYTEIKEHPEDVIEMLNSKGSVIE